MILNQLFHVRSELLLLDLHMGFPGDRIRWSGIPMSFKNFPQFVVIHTVKGFGVVNEAEVDAFLEFTCFFYDLVVVGNLISYLGGFIVIDCS